MILSVPLKDSEPLQAEVTGHPWKWRDFLCFVRPDAADEQVSYVPLANIEGDFTMTL